MARELVARGFKRVRPLKGSLDAGLDVEEEELLVAVQPGYWKTRT